MAKRPRAAWTGVIAFPELGLEVDGWLHASQRRGRTPLPIVLIHTSCKTSLAPPAAAETAPAETEEAEEERTEAGVPAAEPPAAAPVVATFHCPRCNRPVKTDEIGRAVETETLGLVPITETEQEALKAKLAKRVEAQLITSPTGIIESLGLGRRLWVFPKPVSTTDYYLLIEILRQSSRVGFVPEIVIQRRPYVLTIRPLETDAEVHGTRAPVLVADEFNDTDTLRSPAEFGLLPASPPPLDGARLAQLAERAAAVKKTVDLGICVNPERRKFRALVAQKVSAARTL